MLIAAPGQLLCECQDPFENKTGLSVFVLSLLLFFVLLIFLRLNQVAGAVVTGETRSVFCAEFSIVSTAWIAPGSVRFLRYLLRPKRD